MKLGKRKYAHNKYIDEVHALRFEIAELNHKLLELRENHYKLFEIVEKIKGEKNDCISRYNI